ncbi:MAG: hypothetical protein J6W24_04125 [Prevotella sp.]|nr:hypothetical protein [Prevotella sp.]
MKKIYLKPLAEFEEIEGLNDLMDELSRFDTKGEGTTGNDTKPAELPWGEDTPGYDPLDPGTGDDDPNG